MIFKRRPLKSTQMSNNRMMIVDLYIEEQKHFLKITKPCFPVTFFCPKRSDSIQNMIADIETSIMMRLLSVYNITYLSIILNFIKKFYQFV